MSPRFPHGRTDVVIPIGVLALCCLLVAFGAVLLFRRGGEPAATGGPALTNEQRIMAMREGLRFNPGIIDPPGEAGAGGVTSATAADGDRDEEAELRAEVERLMAELGPIDDEMREEMVRARLLRDLRARRDAEARGDDEKEEGTYTLHVRVVHAMTGGDIAGARIDVANQADGTLSVETEGATVSMELRRTGRAILRVSPPPGGEFKVPDPIDVATPNPTVGHTEVTVALVPVGKPVEGYVMDTEDNPIAGATVSWRMVRPRTTAMPPPMESLTTDDEGFFLIEDVLEEWPIETLNIEAEGHITETRAGVRPSDGLQLVRLQKSNTVTLAVLWEYDRSPVTEYSFRLLNVQSFLPEMRIDGGRAARHVDSADGRTVLEDISSGVWRVEVAILDSEGGVTDIRTGVDFEFHGGGEAQEVVVLVDAGRGIRGTVVNEIGTPIPGASVHLVPPIRLVQFQNDFAQAEDPFEMSRLMDLPQMRTGADGGFDFPGIPPGDYLLVASWEDRLTPVPVLVSVPVAENPPHVTVEILRGAIIEGHVRLPEGSPRGFMMIWAARTADNMGGWSTLNATVDDNGFYRLERLNQATYWVGVSVPEYSSRMVTIEARMGETVVHDFDFTNMVTVTGRVTLDGTSGAALAGRYVLFRRVGGFNEGNGSIGPDGSYELKVQPGEFTALMQGSTGEGPRVVVSPAPDRQTHNIDFRTGAIQIIAVYPEGERFQPGNVTIRAREMSQRYGMIFDRMEQETRSRTGIIEGDYAVTFTSRDRQWRAQSEWLAVRGGQTTEFVLEMEPTFRGERLGSWGPSTIRTEMSWLNFPVSGTLPAGQYEVLMTYERGQHAAETAGAMLLNGMGQVVSQQMHGGWTGIDHAANAYLLTVTEPIEAGDAMVRVQMRSDGGTDSYGSVYLTRR